MKIHELLLEYNQQLTVRNWGQQLLVKAQEREHDLELTAEQLVQEFEKADPTRTKSYMKWIIREYLVGNFLLEDISYLNQVLTVYHQYKRQLPVEQRDIGRLSRGDVNGIYLQITEPEPSTEADTDLNIPGVKVIYSGPLGHLVIPETFAASKILGKGTSWCTRQRKGYFNQYSSQGPLYIWIERLSRGGEKMQFHFESAQFMDSRDRRLSEEVMGQLLFHPIIGKFFKKYEDTLKQSGNGEKLINFWNRFPLEVLKKHAPGKMAFKGPDGEYFIMNGKLHREDGPARTYPNGTEAWFLNGQLHREGAPAVIKADGSVEWYLNGGKHRVGAPAVIKPDGYEEWWLNGGKHRVGAPAVTKPNGSVEWWLHGKLHREGGPAIISAGGTERWYLNGKHHRIDGPATVCPSGAKEWRINGKEHREDGPAVIWSCGTALWYRKGKVHREDGPAIIWASGGESWYINGKRHREDGPAAVHADGRKEWLLNGKLHREDGPALTATNGYKGWYLNNHSMTKEQHAAEMSRRGK